MLNCSHSTRNNNSDLCRHKAVLSSSIFCFYSLSKKIKPAKTKWARIPNLLNICFNSSLRQKLLLDKFDHMLLNTKIYKIIMYNFSVHESKG